MIFLLQGSGSQSQSSEPGSHRSELDSLNNSPTFANKLYPDLPIYTDIEGWCFLNLVLTIIILIVFAQQGSTF